MKKTLATLTILALVSFIAVSGALAADPTPLEGQMTSATSLTNGLGRSYDVTGIYLKTLADTTTTNVVTIAVKNTQDSAVVTYTIKTMSFTTGADWKEGTTDLIRVPIDAVLYLANSAGSTNDYLIFREDSDK